MNDTPYPAEIREYLYKILVIGDVGTGKTSIIKRYVHNIFSMNYKSTIGVDFALKVIQWSPDTVVRLQLWDIAGQERASMARVYYKEAVAALIVYDVTRPKTFEAVKRWKADLDSKVTLPGTDEPIHAILLANKTDLQENELNSEELDEFCEEHGFLKWFGTSAKDNRNIEDATQFLLEKILASEEERAQRQIMSLQVNFTTYGHELKAAYEDILRPVNPQGGNNWALFGYDKGTNDLKVLGQGSGGLEELEDEFADGKIQYAFVRTVDPYSQLNKFVLIAWCGDGVPESKKGLFNSHLTDVSQFLKVKPKTDKAFSSIYAQSDDQTHNDKAIGGYHLQINARNEADVTPAQIMKRLDEGSGSKYSTHKESYEAERIRPLQSAYKKTEIPDIAALQRNPTKPEPAPKYNIGTKPVGYSSSASSAATPAKLEDRVWPPPSSTSSSSPASPPVSTERSWKTSVGGAGSYTSSTPSNKVVPPASLSSFGGGASSAPEPAVNKAHQIRLEREAREKEERERIKREIEASEARQRQSASSGAGGPTSTAQRLAEERKLQAQKEAEREKEQQQASSRGGAGFSDSPSGLSNTPNRIREERLAREKEERERAQAEDSARSAREAFKTREVDSLREQTSAREDDLKRQKEHDQRKQREAREAEERHAQEQSSLQRQQQEEEEEEAARQRQQQEEEEEEERRAQQQRQRQKDEDEAKQRRQREQQEADDRKRRQAEEDAAEEERQRRQAEEEEEREHERHMQEEVNAAATQSVNLGADALLASTEHPELTVSGSVSAIVLYSYEKAEENEMSLLEGEIIRNVTELDVGWWSGESEDGTRSGLFPANYVEVIEHAQEQEQHHDAHDDHHAAAAAHDQHQDHEAEHEAYSAQHAPAAPAAAAGGEKKPTAVALYDYQAGEPNELSFNEGETITEIDFVTEDWWSGKSDAGASGLFPANYVEIIQ
ncbi:rab32, member RAS oncoprotein [Linnemannia hyalina]|uniref:Rab32, member RAS oncoprotein n=1 Tax=Linnemannia hyalina TaxID=64524 RepID=A0A9P7XY93_9FUNG|nr:rab32, member RAS oncoprotein [Linnemannia hyalina]